MPSVRRSNRIQTKKTSAKNNPSANFIISPKKEVSENKKSKASELCVACKQENPPIRRYNVVEWAQCDHCDKWWHAECACITAEDCVRFSFYDISYTCALCVLKASPWVAVNHNISLNDSDTDIPKTIQREEVKGVKSLKGKVIKKEKEINSSSVQNCENKSTESEQRCGNVIVVDNIKEAQQWKSSRAIKEKLSSFEELKKINFAYSLPRGGIAIHCNSDKEAEETLENWPTKVFSEQEKPHRPKEVVPCRTGYLKNIDVKIKDSDLKEYLSSKKCKV